jgi:hypothetical protein
MSNLPKLPDPTIAGSMLTTKSGVFCGMYTEAQMLQFQRETLEACAKVVERDLYPDEKLTYAQVYNNGVRRTSQAIRRLK